jgi:hypothetical protein
MTSIGDFRSINLEDPPRDTAMSAFLCDRWLGQSSSGTARRETPDVASAIAADSQATAGRSSRQDFGAG